MSSFRTRCSPPPPRAKGDRDTPKSAWSQQPNDVSVGTPANELWGVSTGPKQRRRGAQARARRRAKRLAKLKHMPLKAYLRAEAKKEQEKSK